MPHEKGKFPSSIFNINREYTVHLMKAIEAARAKADELGLDLGGCSIDCQNYRPAQSHNTRILSFWFYSEELVNWMDGYSEDFYDITVNIDADTGQVVGVHGPSRC